MKFKVATGKVTSSPNAFGWAQVYEFKPQDAEKFEKRGEIFAAISTKTVKGGIDNILAGREMLARLHEEYFGKVDGSPTTALKNALNRVLQEFSKWEDIEISSCSLVGKTLYLGVGGGGSIMIYRQGELSKVLESEEGRVVVASGPVNEGDILILGSSVFFETLAKGVLGGALSTNDPKLAAEFLTPILHAKEEKGNLVAVIAGFQKGDELEVSDEAPLTDASGIFSAGFVGAKSAEVENSSHSSPESDSAFSAKADEATKTQQKQYQGKGMVINEEKNPITRAGFEKFVLGVKNTLYGLNKIRSVPGVLGQRKYFDRRIQDVRVKTEEEGQDHRKRITISVGVILFLALGVSIFFGVRRKIALEYKDRYSETLSEAEHNLTEAMGVYSINPLRSRELFVDSQNKVLGLMNDGVNEPEVVDLNDKILAAKSKILGEFNQNAVSFVDLTLLSSGFSGDFLSFSGGNVFVLDKNGRKIVGIGVASKESRVVAGPSQIAGADFISSQLDRVFISNNEGIFEIDQEKAIAREWGGDILFSAYAGNIYVLDKVGSTIWRYPGTGSVYLDRQNWITEGNVYDFTQVSDFVINGSIWILTPPRKISKFSLGNQVNFAPSGVFPEIITIDNIFVSDETEALYVLEKDAQRIVVLTKDGEYKAQYITETIRNTTDFVVSEEDKKIILLTGDKLYSLELKHF